LGADSATFVFDGMEGALPPPGEANLPDMHFCDRVMLYKATGAGRAHGHLSPKSNDEYELLAALPQAETTEFAHNKAI
jgi:hypothetical protein